MKTIISNKIFLVDQQRGADALPLFVAPESVTLPTNVPVGATVVQGGQVLKFNGSVWENPVLIEGAPTVFVAEITAAAALTAVDIVAGNTVDVGLLTYTFVTALTSPAVAYEVLLGADVDESLVNLAAAINGSAGEGTLYGTGTEAHPEVTASASAGLLDLFSTLPGAAGNSTGVGATLEDGAFSTASLEGGEDEIPGTAAPQGAIRYTEDFLYIAVAATAVDDTDGWRKVALTTL